MNGDLQALGNGPPASDVDPDYGYVGELARLDQGIGAQMPKARLARASDLERLLDLFRVSEVSSIAEPLDRAERIWSETLEPFWF